MCMEKVREESGNWSLCENQNVVNNLNNVFVQYSVQVYRAKIGSDHYEHIQNIEFYFCTDFCNEYFKYLPDVIAHVVKRGRCLPEVSRTTFQSIIKGA